jgi:hypothetical protein
VSSDPGDGLLEELRLVLRRTDPVPAEVTDFAKTALGWRRLEADLAELLEDSALQTESTALARGGGPRSLTFRSDNLTIDVELRPGSLLGQLSPAAGSAAVELQDDEGAVVATTESDTLGRFRLGLEGDGRRRLRVVRPDAVPVETSWFSL